MRAGENSRYDGLDIFAIDLSRLLSGDVFLTRNVEAASFKGKAQSKAIAKATGGRFSHALLCTTPPTLIEAVGGGVSNITAQVCFVHDLKNVRVLRYHNRAIASAAGSAALGLLGKGYSVRHAIQSILPGKSMPAMIDDGTFCSALVATVFLAVGAPDFATIDPMKTTPADFDHFESFTDVTAQVFRRIRSPRNIEEMSALDGDRVETPIGVQARLFNSYCAIILPSISELAKRYPSLFVRRPTTFLECLGFIIEAFVALEKLPPDIDADSFRQQLVAIDNIALDQLSQGKFMEMIKEGELNDARTIQYTISESFEPSPDIDRVSLQGMIITTMQQIAARSGILNSEEHPAGYSRAWDLWLEMSRDVVRIQNDRLNALLEVMGRLFPAPRDKDGRTVTRIQL